MATYLGTGANCAASATNTTVSFQYRECGDRFAACLVSLTISSRLDEDILFIAEIVNAIATQVVKQGEAIAVIQPKLTHSWQLSAQEALILQCQLSTKVIREDRLSNSVKRIAGVDVAYNEQDERLFAAVVVLDAETLEAIEISSIVDIAQFPYIPGLFSFRELPPIAKALENLTCIPDLIVCDGQGIAHPRRFGLACHLGVLYDLPTIGCSKTRLLGDSEIPGEYRGDVAPLLDSNEQIGHVLRTQDRVKPVYVSVGHRISLQTACNWILKLAPLYRLPETTRLADRTVRNLLRTTLLK